MFAGIDMLITKKTASHLRVMIDFDMSMALSANFDLNRNLKIPVNQ